MRPTVHDIAAAAGVSLATVDRVLNKRPGVRDGHARQGRDARSRRSVISATWRPPTLPRAAAIR